MCARFVCSLIHTTRPSQRPLMLVNAAMPPRQRALLVAAGAEVVETPPLPPWNQSAVIWAARPTALRAYAEPKRIEQFYKLYLWHPAMVGHARRIVYIDPDALVIRSVAHLLDETHQPAPAALHASDRCAAQASIWQPRAGIAVGDGRVAKKCEYYWNAGVIVFEPSQRLFCHARVREGGYPNPDPSCCASGRRARVYWRELGGRRVHPLPPATTTRAPMLGRAGGAAGRHPYCAPALGEVPWERAAGRLRERGRAVPGLATRRRRSVPRAPEVPDRRARECRDGLGRSPRVHGGEGVVRGGAHPRSLRRSAVVRHGCRARRARRALVPVPATRERLAR